MEEYIAQIFIGFFLFGFIGIRILVRLMTRRKSYRFFKEIAHENNFTAHKEGFIVYPELRGTHDSVHCFCEVDVEFHRLYDNFTIHFRTEHKNFQTRSLLISNDTYLINTFKVLAGVEDIEVGDTNFDTPYILKSSNKAFLMALLTKDIRETITQIKRNTKEFGIDEKAINIVKNFSYINRSDDIANTLSDMAEVSNAIKGITNIREALIENIKQEPVLNVRINNLKVLLETYEKDEWTISLFKDLLHDKDLSIQIEVTKYLGKKGLKHLIKIINEPEQLQVEQFKQICNIFSDAGYKDAIPHLKKCFQKTDDTEEKLAILKTFKDLKDKSIIPFLIIELESTYEEPLVEIVKILGAWGNRDALIPINRVLERSSGSVKRAAKKAIDRIKDRLSDSEGGWLSLKEYENEEGALSINDTAEEGALSAENDGE